MVNSCTKVFFFLHIDGKPTGKGSIHDLENKNLRGLPKEKEKSRSRSRSPNAFERPGFSM